MTYVNLHASLKMYGYMDLIIRYIIAKIKLLKSQICWLVQLQGIVFNSLIGRVGCYGYTCNYNLIIYYQHPYAV